MALLLVVFAMSCFCTSIAPAIGACDGNKACIGRAYTASVATGQNHHYVNVAASPSLRGISAQMTVEMWINASRQSGGRVLIAGIWGPYTDDNDVWVLYISPSDELTFEVNGPLDRGALDNTIARAPFVAYYGRWTHIAATFDAGTVRLYINGVLQDSAYNQQYPATQVRQPRNPSSALKIGSINGFFDSPSNRAFIGQLDEIRIWTRTLQRQEIACNRFRSLEGNEPGLVLYFRCNEQENDFLTPLCDASGNGNNGRLFSGATCRPPSPARTIPRSVTMAPQAINEQLDCDSSRTWTLTLADTTECGSTVSLSIGGRDRSFFRVVPNTIMLPPGGVPMTATVSYNGYLTGTIQAFVRIVGGNRCSYSDTIRFQLTRRTELAYTPARIAFDTLFARCPSRAYLDTTIRICNESALLGTARAVTITGALTRLTSVFRAFPAGGRTFPLVLQPGECADIVVRFSAQDTTLLFLDTLFILSTDRCPGNGIIPLSGQTQQVFAIRRPNGSTPITSFQFPGTCPGDLSSPQAWNWYNMTGRNLIIDSVVYPRVLVAVRMPRFPYTLPPSNQTGEFEKYFRFRPLQPGVVRDSVVFYARLPGEPCQFVIVIPLTGRGLDKDVEFAATAIDFGNVIVGQEARRDVVLRNNSSTDVLTVSLYLKRGEEFVLLQRNVQVAPLQTRTLTNILAFRPTNAVDYTDTLCLFEQRCYMSGCIPIRGRGIIEKFRYEPPVLQVERVLSCDSSSAIIEIINESSIEQQLTNLRLDDPSGTLFTIDTITGARIQLPPSLRISPGGRVRIAIRFVPSSRGNDIAVVGFIRYRSASGEDWMVQVRANSITPKLYVTPTTDYGTIEVGEVRDNLVAIENISPVPVRIDRVNVPIGFTIQSISPPLPVVLSQRDSLMVIVRFAPAAVGTFNAPITVESDSPCVAIRSNGELRGRAIIYRLDAPISIQNFSYVRPCECIVREIPLANNSVVHPMTIDSLVIDSIGIPNATPQLFTFTSTYYEQNSRNLPYTIPPQTTDTLRIVFCPRTAADTSQVVASARLRIVAHGVGWNDRYDVYLIGRRALTFRPSPTQFSFPITLVDVDAAVNPNSPPVSRLTIPSLTWNPFQDTVQIDSITFIPDERVFRYTLTDERNRPVTLPYRLIPGTSASLNIRFDFRPRAPRTYRARVGIYYSKPCIDLDTTIFLVGIGAAGFPYAMYLQFDSSGVALDTFRVISCDTLHVPVYASRALPKTSAQRSLIDFACRFTYDTTKLKLIGVTPGYNATLQTLTYDSAGAVARLEKLLDVDSLGRMLIAHFIPLRRQRDTATIEIGEFDFNTTEILRYDLSTTRGDRALVIIEAATITLMSPPSQGVVSFDSVRVLDCDQRQIVIRNTGDVPLTIDSLLNLPPTMRAIAFVPDRSVPRLPGEETIVTIEYCPRDFSHVDTLSVIVSTNPCRCADTLRILGKGYAPPFPLRITTDPSNPANPSARGGTLGDTITIPLLLDRDVAASYHGTTYWLEAFSFGFRVQWNPTMLKYLGIESRLPNGVLRDTFGFPATLHAGIHRVPTMRGDTFALLRFRIAVPDTISDVLVIEPTAPVQTDSLLFLDVQLLGSTTPTLAGGKCGVTIARPGTPGGFLIVEPNPADNRVRLSIALEEYTSPTVEFLSISGNRSIYARDFGTLAPGVHTLEISTAELPTGVYRVIVSAGVVRASGMVVVLH
ncbi:MAG: choice-of-anchor D domain-containing protein [Chlorobi bacterium]|nr:choice-of-anchor D domain-containing protein [Chlorobiota bacterium]